MPAILLAVAFVFTEGCAAQKWAELRRTPQNPLAEQWHRMTTYGVEPSERTMLVLRRFDLVDLYERNPRDLCVQLRARFAAEPAPDTLYALAELAYLGGKRADTVHSKHAQELYASAVMHSYMYLFDERFSPYQNSYDPHFRGACEVYNGALENLLRIAQKQNDLAPGKTHSIEAGSQTLDIVIACHGESWRNDDIAEFKFVSDYEVSGLRNHYHAYGLGVPLIAMRKKVTEREGAERYYPPGLSFPATAFLRLEPSKGEKASRYTATLELHDPLEKATITVANRLIPLESDLTTPFAYFLSQPGLAKLDIATEGVLRPEQVKSLEGIYMLEPYRSDRIPVLMVHGLWSSPITWMEMFNDLRGSPEIRSRYQFWFYLYPTGQPFWFAASRLRGELAQLRQTLDAQHQYSTLDQMVLVGHSMGGLVAKLQTLESGNNFWNTVSNEPIQLVKASNDIRAGLENVFFFRPNPSVKRVITIATPHRGSRFSNDATRYLSSKLIELPRMMLSNQMQLKRDNPGIFRPHSPIDVSTSIESLSVNSTFLPVILAAEQAPGVRYHNIVGKIPRSGFAGTIASAVNEGASDGVVAVASAHLDSVESEIIVNADHSKVHAHPLTVLEVRRILLEHLTSLSAPQTSPLERLPWTAQGASEGPALSMPAVQNSDRWARETQSVK
jgi:pimeloyl-ACP methyl ester carboxylesterase